MPNNIDVEVPAEGNSAEIASVDAWLEYISQLHHKEMDFGLDRILAVVKPLGWHQFTCPVVIVGGTNGKGSCVRFLESIFTAAGYRVGAYTSPHLMCFNERIRVANVLVDDAKLLEAFALVERYRGAVSLSFFEYTFLAALCIFQQAALDLVVLEVGLGGRLDAVNIVDADIAVITTVDLDHTDLLGPDRESIAKEKAGIFRQNRVVVCGDPEPPQALMERAKQLGARWYGIDSTFFYTAPSSDGSWQWRSDQRTYAQLPALSLKQQNAATSLMVVELLQNRLPVTEFALKQGLQQTTLAGRYEKMPLKKGYCYVDVAHNPQGGRWLAEQWRQTPVAGKRIAILGMLNDKDIAGTVQSLLHYVDEWFVVSLAVPRGANAQRLQTVLTELGALSCRPFDNVELALQAAIASADLTKDVVLIFGSFYTVAAARNCLLSYGESYARSK